MAMQLKDTMQQLSIGKNREKLKIFNFLHHHRHRLDVVPQATSEVDWEIGCVSSCLKKHTNCFSVNTRRNENGKFLCQFLNTSIYRLPAEKLIQDDAFVHWYSQDPCVPFPCKNNGNCVQSQSSSGWKQFSCECVDGYFGNICQKPIDSTHNYALRKPTNMSTLDWNAEKAVDGNRNTNYYAQSCTHTDALPKQNQWWRVDLEQTISVAYVVITNRGDCCGYRLSNFEIKIGDSLVEEGNVNPKCGDKHSIGEGLTEVITCSPPLSGRYVLLQSLLYDLLTICELEVYGKP